VKSAIDLIDKITMGFLTYKSSNGLTHVYVTLRSYSEAFMQDLRMGKSVGLYSLCTGYETISDQSAGTDVSGITCLFCLARAMEFNL
jgi:hypothetical protein